MNGIGASQKVEWRETKKNQNVNMFFESSGLLQV